MSDVDGRHNYAYTKAYAKGRRVSISTYKHKFEEIAQALGASGFEIVKSDSVGFDRLRWQPPAGSFASIDRFGARPIFFAFLARASL